MDAHSFSRCYKAPQKLVIPEDDSNPLNSVEYGDFRGLFASSRMWSAAFGSLLQAKLTGAETQTDYSISEILNRYQSWDTNIFGRILDTQLSWYREILARDPESEMIPMAIRERNHATFHEINRTHISQWSALIIGAKPEDVRLIAQDTKFTLSVMGSHYSQERNQRVQKVGEPAWLSHQFEKERSSIEGFLHEADAGIVLNDLAAHRDHSWICVPAPSHFEIYASRTPQGKNANVDYILYDPSSKEVVGVQVKSRVEQSTIDEYDPDRVVLVDGRRDLHNEAPKRSNRIKSDTRIVSWGGQIAVEHLARLPLKHKEYSRLIMHPKTMQLKRYAQSASKKAQPQMRKSAERISHRIKAKLYTAEESTVLVD